MDRACVCTHEGGGGAGSLCVRQDMRPFRVFRAAPVALALLGILLLLEVQRRFLDGCAQPASLLLRTDGTRSPPPPSPCAERRSIYELQPHLLTRGLPGAADEPLEAPKFRKPPYGS